MALWKLTVTRTGLYNGVRIEKGMSVEMVTRTYSDPLRTSIAQNAPEISKLFENKYGVDLLKGHLVTCTYLTCERIS